MTSRGSIRKMEDYLSFLNRLYEQGECNLEEI